MEDYGHILGPLDVGWCVLFALAIVCVCTIRRYRFIKPAALASFLALRLVASAGFSAWALASNQAFDPASHFLAGRDFAAMFGDLLRGHSFEFLRDTPFWGWEPDSTGHFRSLVGVFISLNGGSFMACTFVIGTFGAIGQLLIFKYLRERFPGVKEWFLYPLLFHPSLILWSALMTKDAMGIFSLGLLIYNVDKVVQHVRLRNVIGTLIGVQIAIGFRSFILVMVLVFVFAAIWDRKIVGAGVRLVRRSRFVEPSYIILCAIASVALLVVYLKYYGQDMIEAQQTSTELYADLDAGSNIRNVRLEYSFEGVLALPIGVVNALFRPFIWEARQLNQLVAAIENLVVLGVVFYGWRCYFFRLTVPQRRSLRGVFWGQALMCLVCAAGVGLYCSNLGTISRYRIPLIPELLGGPCLAIGFHHLRRGWSVRVDEVGRAGAIRARYGGPSGRVDE